MTFNISRGSALIFLAGYKLIAEQAECSGGKGIYKGQFASPQECAQACKQDQSEAFIFSTNKYGGDKCFDAKCSCLCELETKDRKCIRQIRNKNFLLYGFVGKICYLILLILRLRCDAIVRQYPSERLMV